MVLAKVEIPCSGYIRPILYKYIHMYHLHGSMIKDILYQ